MVYLKAPTVLYIQLASSCRDHCPGCMLPSAQQKLLSLIDWKKILDKALPYVHEVRFMGGDPALSEYFYPLLDFMEERQALFSIFSNGRWPEPERVIRELRYYRCLHQLVVTCAGHNAAVHDWYTKTPGSFDEMRNNAMQAAIKGLRVQLQCVIHRKNYRSFQDLQYLARSVGAQSLILGRHHCCIPCQDRDEERLMGAGEFLKLRDDMEKPGLQRFPARFARCTPRCYQETPEGGCYGGLTLAAVDPCGNLHPCPNDPLAWGNLLHSSLTELWKSRAATRWRQPRLHPRCSSCPSIDQCQGGCRILEEKDPLVLGFREPGEKNRQEETEPPRLGSSLSPVGHFLVREEDFGFALVKGHVVIPAGPDFVKIKDMLHGRHRLSEIQEQAGDDLISFLYSLHERNFVTFI